MEKVQQLIEIIKSLRTNNKISMQRLVDSIGCKSSAAYCYKENGKSPIYIDEFIKICDLLDITLDISYKLNNEIIEVKNNIDDIISMIIELREKRDISKNEISGYLDITFYTYSAKEDKSKKFTLDEFIKICQLLNINCKINYVIYTKDTDKNTLRNEKEFVINRVYYTSLEDPYMSDVIEILLDAYNKIKRLDIITEQDKKLLNELEITLKSFNVIS